MEFFFIKDPYGKWTFPKGHQELGETLAETAVREIREETGLTDLKFVAPLGRTIFSFRRSKTVIAKTVFLFLFEAPAHAVEELPGTEGITEAAWFPIQQALTVSGYRNLDRLLSKALHLTASRRRNSQPQKNHRPLRADGDHPSRDVTSAG
ncbi:NUDIX domain-containing protein [Candidatus Uhrbacteria bacterium]|nr:NUDIX domain-containing protein [Candidatus Uhrbacteria bacterium]